MARQSTTTARKAQHGPTVLYSHTKQALSLSTYVVLLYLEGGLVWHVPYISNVK